MAAVRESGDVCEEDILRAQYYGLLGTLLGGAPDAALLGVLSGLEGDGTPFGGAVSQLATAARTLSPDSIEDEYTALFIGVPEGEVLPYASYYLTGFLHDKPLAALRADLCRLGIARAADVAEPEDHAAFLCQVMVGLIRGDFGRVVPLDEQRWFFDAHLGPWLSRFFTDLEAAPSGIFYREVGKLGRIFARIEADAFAMT